MSTILEQFKNRKLESGTVKVLFPSKDPELELQITRVPYAMERRATNKGFIAAVDGGDAGLVVERAEMMLKFFETHITGWKVLKKGWLEYSEQEKKDLLSYLDTGLMLDLVSSYDRAAREDSEKSGKESRPDSSER